MDADRRRKVAAARAGFLASGAAQVGAVPDVIAASWQRSRSAGVNAGSSQATYHGDLDVTSRLVRCSRPILDRLSQETADIPLSIAITDAKARVLTRVDTSPRIGRLLDEVSFAPGFEYAEGGVGTNAVGTVFGSGQPIQIVGPEHFHERLQPFACSGAPIRDPFSRRVEGVLDISCLTEHFSRVMHSLVQSAVHEIERNLLIDRSHHQQVLFESYVRADARSHGAVMAVGDTVAMANTVAQGLLTPMEQQSVQHHARYLTSRQDRAVDQIELGTGKVVRLRATRVRVGEDTVGVVLEVALVAEGGVCEPGPRLTEPLAVPRPRLGTDAESRLSPLPASPTPSLSGQSPLWTRARQDIAAALSQHQALLVMGETGTGKLSLLTEAHHRVNPGGRTLLIEAADILDGSYPDAEATVLPTLYVFRNIDQLTTAGVERLDSFLLALADTERPAYVAATLSDVSVEVDLPFRDLLVHFQQAVTVPPLRHRNEDIPVVVAQILRKISIRGKTHASPAALRVLCRYSWPRNITQLEQALSTALRHRPVGDIQPEDLPGYCHDAARRRLTGIEALERDAIVKALQDAEGNRVQAAAALGIARSSLYRKLKSYGIGAILP